MPDLSIQLALCVPQPFLPAVTQAVRDSLTGFTILPEVRAACINGTQRVGAWLAGGPFPNPGRTIARIGELRTVDLLRGGESFAILVSADAVRTMAQQFFDTQVPKEMGIVRLRGIRVFFQPPNQVVTRVNGFARIPIGPDVDFDVTITDTLSVQNGLINCSSRLQGPNLHDGALQAVREAIIRVLNVFGAAIKIPNVPPQSGVGCIAASLLPRQVLLPMGMKAFFNYSRVGVDQSGLSAGGTVMTVPRMPAVHIGGITRVLVPRGAREATAALTAQTTDLLPPIRYQWRAAGGALTSPTSMGTGLRISLTGNETGELSRQVFVTVTDADGLLAMDRTTVAFITGLDPEEIFCMMHPTAPRCRGPR